jgi:glycosyltransferase involved in cell wall biosynthesis
MSTRGLPANQAATTDSSPAATVRVDIGELGAELLADGDGIGLTVLIPAFNEEESLSELVRWVVKELSPFGANFEILVIDDGSTDGTAAVLRALGEEHPPLRSLSFLRNYGKSAALAVGFREARGRYVVTMDADLQDDPAEILPLLSKLSEGFDLVSGWKQDRKDPFVKTSSSKVFNRVTRWASGLDLHDFNCGLKAYRQDVAKSLQVYGEMHRYLPVLAHVMGFRVTEIGVRHHPRRFGQSKFGRSRFLNGLFDLMTVLFLTRQRSSPLHFFGRVGLVFGVLGGIISLYFLSIWFGGAGLRLRPLMLLGIAFLLVGIQFVSLGLIAELFVASRDSTEHYRIREEDSPRS